MSCLFRFITLFLYLNQKKLRKLKENRCKFKTDEITYLKSWVEQLITLSKVNLPCIYKVRKYNKDIHSEWRLIILWCSTFVSMVAVIL